MDALRIVRYSSFAGILAVLSIGCGGPSGVDAAPQQSSPAAGFSTSPPVDGADSLPASSPPTEGSGPETPQPGGNSRPSIPVPSLPIGGDTVAPPDRAPTCASTAWLGDAIPAGVSVSVTAAMINPAAFVTASSGCGGNQPLCLDVSFAFTADHTGCGVPVAATGDAGAAVKLTLAGTASCPSGQRAFCARLAEAGKNAEQGSIVLVVPPQDTTVTGAPTPTAPTDGGSPGSTG